MTDLPILVISIPIIFLLIFIILIIYAIIWDSELDRVKDNNHIWELSGLFSDISVSDRVKDRDFKNDRECAESASKWFDKGRAFELEGRYEEAIKCFLENANLTAGMKERIMNVIEIWKSLEGSALILTHLP